MHAEFHVNRRKHRVKNLQRSYDQAASVFYLDDDAYAVQQCCALAVVENQGSIVFKNNTHRVSVVGVDFFPACLIVTSRVFSLW